MSENPYEALSALMDGELAKDAARQSIKDLGRDPSRRRYWDRCHLIAAAMRRDLSTMALTPNPAIDPVVDPVIDKGNLADRVRQAVAAEPVSLAAHSRLKGRYLKPVAGFALAASVATVAILGVRTLSHAPEATAVSSRTSASAVATTATAPNLWNVQPLPTERAALGWRTQNPSVAARLNGYLINHNEVLEPGMRSVLPYARLMGHERNRPVNAAEKSRKPASARNGSGGHNR